MTADRAPEAPRGGARAGEPSGRPTAAHAQPPSEREARSFAHYLIGEPPAPGEIERYRSAVALRGAEPLTERDRRLLERMVRHPWTIGPLDAGLALIDPESPVRFRLCLMLAVLEASPAHCRHFLPAPYPRTALLGLALRMAAATLRAGAGVAMVRTWGVLWK